MIKVFKIANICYSLYTCKQKRFFRYKKRRQYGVSDYLDDLIQLLVQNNYSVNYVHSFSFFTFVLSNLDIL